MQTQRIVYNDKVVRQFLWASVLFGIVGMLVGIHVALELAFWPANLAPYLSFGRLRPLHTNALIFAFVGNMLFSGIYYSTQRLVKARLASDILSAIHFWGWQLIIVAAAVTLPLGITSGSSLQSTSSGRSASAERSTFMSRYGSTSRRLSRLRFSTSSTAWKSR
jgi:cytochrome c oxidase cbb3-type subunit I/II